MYFNLWTGRDPDKVNTYNFYGLNRTKRGSRGEFEAMMNMSTLEYPCAAPRGMRKKIEDNLNSYGKALTVIAPDPRTVSEIKGQTGILMVSGKTYAGFFYNGIYRSEDFELDAEADWEIVRIGNRYIMNGYNDSTNKSQMFYYNVDTLHFGVLNESKLMSDLILTSGNDENGAYLQTFRYGFDEVYDHTATVDGKTIKNSDFFDKYGNPIIKPPNIFEQVFSIGDEIQIQGFPEDSGSTGSPTGQVWTYESNEIISQANQDLHYNNTVDITGYADPGDVDQWTIIRATVKGFDVTKTFINGKTAYVHKLYLNLYNKNNVQLGFDQMSSDTTATLYCSGITVSSPLRVFNHIYIHNGRIFGSIPNGENIYVSRSDELENFTDTSINKGYASRIAISAGGRVTGFAEYGSDLVVFKEDSITIVYGDQTYTTAVYKGIGCIDGRSIAETPSGVIFLAYRGFYIFTGGVPSIISQRLNTRYKTAIAGFDGDIYYAYADLRDPNMQEGLSEVVTYDMRYSTWHRQDLPVMERGDEGEYTHPIVGFYRFLDGFYISDIYDLYLTDAEDGEPVEWTFTSIRNYDATLETKAVNDIWIRADIPQGGMFMVATAVNEGDFTDHIIFNKPGLNIVRCPVRAVNGDSYKYRITGKGHVVFYEIEINKKTGGKVFKDRSATEQLQDKQAKDIFMY